ncbi:JAB domain-containing protein [Muricauda oceani]|uniref:JAB domain-containing protein n=1 Tax=Flagellimonas oceani TaxID=2698672 RepID=A0A6G7J0G1_9FLAO|nr:JAB domain-containing protein [Allomuricauda oceani]MBW8244263.1 JAB domain-containing protein [Allomuricauda oceani]QII44088.1 JAB domain-containing protein [Allomuricauda oceani]
MKVNEIKVSYKQRIPSRQWPKISGSQDTAALLYERWDQDTIALYETFKVAILNNGNRVKAIIELSHGGMTGAIVDVRLLFGIVLKVAGTGIILSHNHPSATLTPSQADRQITEKIRKAGAILDIRLLDHIILAPDGSHYSFADEGIL